MNKGKEIKQILLGRIQMDDDGNLMAVKDGADFNLCGLPEGWGSVMLFGISDSYHFYDTELEAEDALYKANDALKHIGRCIQLVDNPDAIGCYCRSLFSAPAFVAAEWEEGRLKVTVFTGRGLFSLLTCFIMHKKYERHLGDEFARINRNEEVENKIEERKRHKEEKKQAKEEKKEQKKSKNKD